MGHLARGLVEPGVSQGDARGVRAAGAVHAAAGMRRGRREVQAAHRRLRPAEPSGRGPEDRLLVELRRAAVESAVHEVGVLLLEGAWREHVARAYRVAEPGRELL